MQYIKAIYQYLNHDVQKFVRIYIMLNVLFFSHYPTYSGMDGGNNILLVTAKGLSSNKYSACYWAYDQPGD